MKSEKQTKLKFSIFCLILFSTFYFLASSFVFASEEKLTLTITPPLIKINISPGDVWSSSVKVVNNNPGDLQVYASVMDFKSGKEGGVEFIQQPPEEGQFLLSQWIEISSDPILIPGYQSRGVPFTIKVPQDAEPGGHYAAILAGTRPMGEEIKGTGIRVALLVSSLILANVQGEIVEEARIREFSTEKTFYQKPEVKFTVRVENTGNVHIQPQGEIRIYNFFGKERGVIPINQKTEFGNVLPKSIRKWTFIWKGEESPLEAGRYKAELVLGYGSEAKQTISSTHYFWVLPLKPTLGILGGFFLFITLTTLMIRAYVRRAVLIAQKEAGVTAPPQKLKPKILKKPIVEAVSDFFKAATKEKGVEKEGRKSRKKEILGFLIKKYGKPCLIILIFILGVVAVSFYFKDVLKSAKSFEVIIEREGEAEVIIPSEEKPTGTKPQTPPPAETEQPPAVKQIDKAGFTIKVLNGSGIPGLATEVVSELKDNDFKVTGFGNADSFNYGKTLITYKIGKQREAEFLNQFFDNKARLLEIETQSEDLVIIVGKDYAR